MAAGQRSRTDQIEKTRDGVVAKRFTHEEEGIMKVKIILAMFGVALVTGLVVVVATGEVGEDPAIILAKQCSPQLHMCASGARGWEMLAGAGR
jgi:hypothetical protein